MSRRKSMVLAALAVLIGSFLVAKLTQPWRWKSSLVAACEGANRVVVELDTFPSDEDNPESAATVVKYDIDGAENVEAFIQAIELTTNWWNDACRCYGDMRFDVFRGTDRVAAVTFHHDRFLRWQDGAWWGDGNLSDESQPRMRKWLKDNGCPTGQKVHERRMREILEQQSNEFEP